MSEFDNAFQNRTVWLSGHTGFKGAWLSTWLLRLGARVVGFSMDVPTQPALFVECGLSSHLDHECGDIRDAEAVKRSILRAKPDFVFHLAAQSLVRPSYHAPVETFATNVMGTTHVLDALRFVDHPCAAVMVASDKCYLNREWVHGYREDDALGGHDPYSASKGASELAVASWRASFFPPQHPVAIASARAGNVIGGGDWAVDRIIPDCVRAREAGRAVEVRNPAAVRPWQHVLEPLSGYLWLAAAMEQPGRIGGRGHARDAFNFGPSPDSSRPVGELVGAFAELWPGPVHSHAVPNGPHEAGLLRLSIDKARHVLGWSPVWGFESSVGATVDWYRGRATGDGGSATLFERTMTQIGRYTADAERLGAVWTKPRSVLASEPKDRHQHG